MTTRSTRSATSARGAKDRLTDGDVYVFLLQAAVMAGVLQAQATREATPAASSPAPASLGRKAGNEASASRSDWMSLGGLADVVRDNVGSSSKSVRFPEKLLKRLSERLEKVAMGRDPIYRDQSLRQTIGIFYGTYKEASFQKQMKDNRKIEELILLFVTTAQASLRKRTEGDAWKAELNTQVAIFVKIIRECLRTIHGVSRELAERLEGYASKLSPDAKVLPPQTGNGAAAESRRNSAASALTAAPSIASSEAVIDHALVRAVGSLFKVDKDQLSRDVDFMKKTCTEQNALVDLKHCIRNINLKQLWPGRREDFQTEEAFSEWRSTELQEISNLMMQMCKANPELLKTSSSSAGASFSSLHGDTSVSAASDSAASANADAIADAIDPDDESLSAPFNLIPPDPRACYRRAMELCMDHDLELIRYQPEEEEVSLSILSKMHIDLLNECALRWRIMPIYHTVANLDVIRFKHDRGEVPLDCISEALANVERTIEEKPLEKWTKEDNKLLHASAFAIFQSFLRFVHDAFQDLHNVPSDDVRPYIELAEAMQEAGFVKEGGEVQAAVVTFDTYAEDLKDRIRIMAIHEYTEKTTDTFSQQIDNEIVPLLALLDWIQQGAKKLDRTYKESIFGEVDPTSLLLEKQAQLFIDDLESMKVQVLEHATQEQDSLPFEDIMALYKGVQELLRMHTAFCSSVELDFDISAWFEPHIRHWLSTTEKKTAEWVHNALASDKFTPIDSEGAVHSSSIDDLFAALQQPLDFILSLEWPDAYQNARFLTSMAKTVSRSIELYCSKVEKAFTEEMFPRSVDGPTQEKQMAWMVKAKQTLQGEKKIEPFHFQPESCVKLNNIEAARVLLDKLYSRTNADEQARIVQEREPRLPERRQQQRYIFTVKVVLGESLQQASTSSASARIDSFVTLSDERGYRIAKTRTIYETADPRWDEVFDITLSEGIWLAATVWDRKLIGEHSMCGRAYLRLDPKFFDDYLNHELWLNLDTQGRLLLRVSMEGEKDDILFYFGRAFRSLKRAEADMVRIIVDKMSIYIRQCLSRSVLKSLVKTSGINLDKALGNVKTLYAQALASTSAGSSLIPPVERDTPKKQRPQQLTDVEIEAAIMPLLDYLDECLGTLKSSLSEDEALLVLTKVWKEVLTTIDGILLPPLSDGHCGMPQLSGREVEVVFKWLSMLRNYFNAYDEETRVAHGVPLEILQGPKYREIVSYTLFHDAPTDDLMESCVREMQKRLRMAPSKRAKSKSVLQQRSLGTIKKRKAEKRTDEQSADDNLDVILRLLRMRSGTSDFLQQQFATMGSIQSAMGNKRASALPTKLPRPRSYQAASLQQQRPPPQMMHTFAADDGNARSGRQPFPLHRAQPAAPMTPAAADQQHTEYFPAPQRNPQQYDPYGVQQQQARMEQLNLQQQPPPPPQQYAWQPQHTAQPPLSPLGVQGPRVPTSPSRGIASGPPQHPMHVQPPPLSTRTSSRPSLNQRLSRTVQQSNRPDGRNSLPGETPY